MLKGISFKAIFIGMLIAMGSTLASSFILVLGSYFYAGWQGVPAQEEGSYFRTLIHTFPMMLLGIALGGLSTLFGGFITGWMAKQYEMKNTAVMGMLLTLTGIPFFAHYPIWYDVLGSLLTIFPAIFGGYLATLLFHRNPSPSVPA
jgi:hypothetical protein